MARWPAGPIPASNCAGHDLPELKPIAFVGSIPTKWECSDCRKRFALPAMTEQEMNPKVAVYKLFERHKCAPKRVRFGPRISAAQDERSAPAESPGERTADDRLAVRRRISVLSSRGWPALSEVQWAEGLFV